MASVLRAVAVLVAVVIMLVVLVSIGTTVIVRVTILSEQFWVDATRIALDAERLVPVLDATAVADVELSVGEAGRIEAARRVVALLGTPGRPVQNTVERYIGAVFSYLNGDIPIEQVRTLFSDEAVDDISSVVNAGFQRGEFDGIADLDYLRTLSSRERREVIGQVFAGLQEALAFHDVPVELTDRSDPAALRDLRSHYLDQRRTTNRALIGGVVAFFILTAFILIAWKSDPIRGLRRVGIPFVILGALAMAAYAAVRFLGPSLIEQALRTLIEQPDTSGAEAETIIVWMTQVHRYLAAIYLRALQPVLTTAIISLVAGVVLLVLPRFETDSDVRSMTPE